MWRSWHYTSFGRGISAFRTKYNMFASIWYLLLVAGRQLLPKSLQRLEYCNLLFNRYVCAVEKRWNDLFFFLNIGFLYRQPSSWLDQCHHRCISLSEATTRRPIDWSSTDHGSSHLTLDRRQQFQSCTITRLSLTKTDAMTNILFDVGFHFQLFKFVRYLIVLMVFVLNLSIFNPTFDGVDDLELS